MRTWKALLLAGGLASAPACTTWHRVPIPQAPAPPNVVSELTRVHLRNGRSADFLTLVVTPDSLFGIRNNLGRTRMSVSYDQVTRIEVRQKDPLRTIGLLTAIALGLLYSGAAGFEPR